MADQESQIAKVEEKKVGQLACVAASIIAIILNFVPYGYYILYPFSLIYTFVHEMGHGISAALVGGEFVKFEMWANGSGVATSAMSTDASGFAHAFVAFGGLIAPAIWAAIFLFLGRSKKLAAFSMFGITLICVLSLILVVRSLFGFFFVALCGAAAFGIGYLSLKTDKSGKLTEVKSYAQYSMLFLAMTLCTCVFSRGDYLFTAVAKTTAGDMPSDVAQISKYLFLPYWFWGALIAVISVAVLGFGLWNFFKPDKKAIENNQTQTL